MYVRVHAVPDARKERVQEETDKSLTIWVKEPAEQNLANRRIRELVAQHYGVQRAQVRMLTGHRSSSKMFTVNSVPKGD
jgi:uncharacterized protein YggU (UPF0235/DUF167 family)